MKISKHIHSCLLVEDQGKTILIDPGNYTFEERALDIGKLEKLDFILITHEHQDHVYLPFLRAILEKFTDVEIITNSAVAGILANENIKCSTSENEYIKMASAPHELVLGKKSFDNTIFNILGQLTHPGDSLQFDKTCDVLALPIQAPWGSFVASVEKAASLKPKIVIPIHDWHWKDVARKKLYEAAKNYLAERGIDFRGLELGAELVV